MYSCALVCSFLSFFFFLEIGDQMAVELCGCPFSERSILVPLSRTSTGHAVCAFSASSLFLCNVQGPLASPTGSACLFECLPWPLNSLSVLPFLHTHRCTDDIRQLHRSPYEDAVYR
eukprot:RCo039856